MSLIPMRLIPMLRERLGRSERGAAMVVTVTLVALCATASMVVASSTIFGTTQTATDRSHLQALAAAEAGRDALLAQIESTPAACPALKSTSGTIGGASYTAMAAWAASISGAAGSLCPADGTIQITATGTAPGGVSKTVVAYYPFRAGGVVTGTHTSTATVTATVTTTTTATVPTIQGAILQGNPASKAMNIPTVIVNGGDLLAASTGEFDCNSDSKINGDLIVPNGSVSLSNQCQVTGSIYAKGDIQLNNLGNHVGGDVISSTGNVTINTATVDGNVRAAGVVTIQNSVTIGKDVVSAGAGQSTFYNAIIKGNVSVAGSFSNFQTMTVTGNVSAAGTTTSKVTPDTVINGSLKLGGDINTWNAGPTVKGGITTKATGMVKPTVAAPTALQRSTWLEIPWKTSDWTAAGWSVTTASASDCNYQSNTTLINAVNNLTTPTVIDASACGAGGVNLYGVTFSLKTNVTFIAQAISAQNLAVNVSGTGTRRFNLVVPDATPSDNGPTCPTGAGASTIYGAVMATGVSGIAYSPCTFKFGTAVWNGQIIAGDPDPAGGAVTLGYLAIGIPGASAIGGTGTATLTALATATTTATVTTTTTTSTSVSPSLTPSLLQQKER